MEGLKELIDQLVLSEKLKDVVINVKCPVACIGILNRMRKMNIITSWHDVDGSMQKVPLYDEEKSYKYFIATVYLNNHY
jgi:hypothetical protein